MSTHAEDTGSQERQIPLQEMTTDEEAPQTERKSGGENPTSPEEKAEEDYPSAGSLTLIFIALCLSTFLVALDSTIIATAIPRITSAFNSIDDVGWYGSAFYLTLCCFQLLFGKLYTYLPVKWVYVTAIVIFEIGSAVCGAAPSSVALIVGRAIAGTGASGLFSGALLIIAKSIPLRRRPLYNGVLGGVFGVASVAGPLLGGVFTDRVSWRWCFYINLPLGAVAVVAIIVFLKPYTIKEDKSSIWEKLKQFDLPGTIILLPTVICLLLALQWGGSKYAWSDGKIIALLVVFGVLTLVWIGLQIWQKDSATVPGRIIRQRSVACGLFFGICLNASFSTVIYYVPIWFQSVKGTSAETSGIDSLPLILSVVVSSIIGGGGVYWLGYYVPFMFLASAVMAVGCGLLTTLTPTSGVASWIGYQIMAGAGVGMGLEQPNLAVQAVLPMSDVSIGLAVMVFGTSIGGAIFVSVGQNVFNSGLLSALAVKVPQVDAELLLQSGASSIREVVAKAYGNDPQILQAVLEAYNEALTRVFVVSTAMAALGVLGAAGMQWKRIDREKMKSMGSE